MTKPLAARWNALVVMVALATMLGCQGLSSSNKASTTTPPQTPTKAGQLTVAPSSISFGIVKVGNNQSQPATMTNTGGSTLKVTQVTATGAGFSVSGLSFPVTLAAGQSQDFNVIFAPQSTGTVSGNLAIANTGATPTVNVALSGGSQTAGTVTPRPASLNFGTIQVGYQQTLSETLTNSGGSTINVTQVIATGAGFAASGLTLPLVLASGQSQSFSVTFTPQAAGTVSGNLSVANTGSTPTVNISLAGGSQTAGALTPSPASLNFGSVQIGSNQALPETLTNTGGSTVTVTQVTPSGSGYSISGLNLPLILAAGANQAFNVTFTPTAAGSSNGSLAIVSNASNAQLNVALSGNGLAPGALTPSPSSLSFGNVQVGNYLQLSETLTNTGGVNVHISQATIAGTGFSMSSWAPLTLAPGQHYTFTVTFTPPSPGNDSGNVAIVSDASNPNLGIPLSGTGTPVPQGQLAVTPTSLNFGNVSVGTDAQLNGTLTASVASVTVNSDTLNNPVFALSGLPSYPIVIPAGQHVGFTVTFTPSATGAASGSLSFASTASNSPTIESLAGTGTPPPQHSVNLSWTASTSQNIIGYNIYRSVTSGGPYSKINPVLNASTLYTDSTVADGVTYYYVSTAVNSSNAESGYSNQTTAVIPPP